MSQLSPLFEAVQKAQDEKSATAQRRQKNEQQLAELRREAINEWMRVTLDGVGIRVPIVDGEASVEDITFSFKGVGWRSYPQYYPLVFKNQREKDGPAFGNMMVNPRIQFSLVVTIDIEEKYRSFYSTIVEWQREIKIEGSDIHDPDWSKIAVEVGEAVLFLQKEKREAPERLRYAEEKRQQEKEERERRDAVFAAERQVEVERQRKWSEENRLLQVQRQERENALRAEVAQKFGVSAEAFDYLIDMLADELQRRNQYSYAE